MAEKITSAPNDLIDDGTNVTISKDRSMVAIDAAAELEELCNLMRMATKDCDGVDLAIRGLSLRAKGLSSIIMSALCDAAETTQELTYRLTGEHTEPVAALARHSGAGIGANHG